MKKSLLVLPAATALLLFSCASPGPDHEPVAGEQSPMEQSMEMTAEPVAEFVDPDAEFSPLQYFDTGMVTLNDRCPVLKTRLNPKMEAVYVNGRPIGFC
jgi:hypothetical protein